MNKWMKVFLLLALLPAGASAQTKDNRELKRIFFNLYTDSIKTILNYYVNIEGEYKDGSYLPLDNRSVELTADHGTISGNEWVAPKDINFEKVTFTVTAIGKPELRDRVTVWLKKAKDPRDAPDYEEMELPYPGSERKRR